MPDPRGGRHVLLGPHATLFVVRGPYPTGGHCPPRRTASHQHTKPVADQVRTIQVPPATPDKLSNAPIPIELLEVQTKRGCWEACSVLPGTLAGPVDVGLCSPFGIGSAVRDGRLRMLGAACKSPAQWGPDTGHHGPKQRASPLRWQPTDG